MGSGDIGLYSKAYVLLFQRTLAHSCLEGTTLGNPRAHTHTHTPKKEKQ